MAEGWPSNRGSIMVKCVQSRGGEGGSTGASEPERPATTYKRGDDYIVHGFDVLISGSPFTLASLSRLLLCRLLRAVVVVVVISAVVVSLAIGSVSAATPVGAAAVTPRLLVSRVTARSSRGGRSRVRCYAHAGRVVSATWHSAGVSSESTRPIPERRRNGRIPTDSGRQLVVFLPVSWCAVDETSVRCC